MTSPSRSAYTDPEVVVEPWPEPEVRGRPATEAETCLAAQRLRKTALTNGWAVTVTYARGTWTPATKTRPAKVVDSLAVLCVRGDERIVGVWLDGKFSSALVPDITQGRLSSVALKERLTA